MAEMPGGCFVSGAKRGDIKVWDVETCSMKSEYTGHMGAINALVVDDNRVFSVSSDKTIKVTTMNKQNIHCHATSTNWMIGKELIL